MNGLGGDGESLALALACQCGDRVCPCDMVDVLVDAVFLRGREALGASTLQGLRQGQVLSTVQWVAKTAQTSARGSVDYFREAEMVSGSNEACLILRKEEKR